MNEIDNNIPSIIFGIDGITAYSISHFRGNKYVIVPLPVQQYQQSPVHSGNGNWYMDPPQIVVSRQISSVNQQPMVDIAKNYTSPTVVYHVNAVNTTPKSAAQPFGDITQKKKYDQRRRGPNKGTAQVTDKKRAEPEVDQRRRGPNKGTAQVTDKKRAEPEGPVAEND